MRRTPTLAISSAGITMSENVPECPIDFKECYIIAKFELSAFFVAA
jgi:hypothetical protein